MADSVKARLARELGRTIAELEETLDVDEFKFWCEYYRTRPTEADVIADQIASLNYTLDNISYSLSNQTNKNKMGDYRVRYTTKESKDKQNKFQQNLFAMGEAARQKKLKEKKSVGKINKQL